MASELQLKGGQRVQGSLKQVPPWKNLREGPMASESQLGGGTAGSGEVEVSGRDAAVCLPILKRGVGLIIFVVALVEKEKGLSI